MIFYFTGTGNSLYAAQRVQAKVGGDLYNIATQQQNKAYEYSVCDGQKVGFVVPVYYYGIPNIVDVFLRAVTFVGGKPEIYLIMTCGGHTAQAAKMFKKAITSDKESDLYSPSYIFSTLMVDNYTIASKMGSAEEVNEVLNKADEEIDAAIDALENNIKGDKDGYKRLFSCAITTLLYPRYHSDRKTKAFHVTDECTSCNLCEQICPERAIEMNDGRPEWVKSQCSLCLGCYHRCPVTAIQYGDKTAGNGTYINPRVQLPL